MTTNKPLTPQEFMNLFEKYVQSYGNEFFFNGARELLNDLRNRRLERNQDAVNTFLCNCLLSSRKDFQNPPKIDFVRDKLRVILSI